MDAFNRACLALKGALDALEEAQEAYRLSKGAAPEERRALADMVDLCMEKTRERARAVDEAREAARRLWEDGRA